MINKLNSLAEHPEWYHSLLTTCNTSIVRIVNQGDARAHPVSLAQLSTGYTPKAAFRLKLIEDWGGLEQTLERRHR